MTDYTVPYVTKAEVESICCVAGAKILWMEELTNRYWRNTPNAPPWYLVMTDIGPIIIGFRKRVIEISWQHTPFGAIVTEDEVTKEQQLVHAHSYLKAAEYLQALVRFARAEIAKAVKHVHA